MQFSQIKTELRQKWKVLHKARDLGANPKSLIAIRNKIYEDQDKLAAEFVKNNIEGKVSDYWFRNKIDLDEQQIKKLEKYYEQFTENIEEIDEETEF
jgi:hypothetical protein